nr:MAG TPA: RING finger protein Z FEVER VIRUS-Z, RING, NEGATIVE [Caudoviricetes sp.]
MLHYLCRSCASVLTFYNIQFFLEFSSSFKIG